MFVHQVIFCPSSKMSENSQIVSIITRYMYGMLNAIYLKKNKYILNVDRNSTSKYLRLIEALKVSYSTVTIQLIKSNYNT